MMFKNFAAAARLATLAQSVIEKYGLYEAECASAMMSNFIVFPFSRPCGESIEPLNRAFQSGLKYGKLHFALSSLGMTCPMLLLTKPLSQSEKRMREIVSTQIQLLESGIHKYWSQGFWQQTLNLMGSSDHMVELIGEAMQEDEGYISCIPDPMAFANFYLRKLELSCYFGCHHLALKYVKLLECDDHVASLQRVCPLIVSKHCFGGITYLAEAKCVKTRYYQRKAKKDLKSLSKLVDKGCIDAKPFYLVLKARFTAFQKKDVDSIRMDFDNAITAAIDCGFQGIAAFACEQAHRSLKEECHEDTCGLQTKYWNSAMEYYTRWEAFGKVDQMRELQRNDAENFTAYSAPPSVVKVNVTD